MSAAAIAIPCILTMITAQAPWEMPISGSSLNSIGPPLVLATLITPQGRSRPNVVLGGFAMRLLSPMQFGLGREDGIGGDDQLGAYFEVSRLPGPLQPGDHITFYAYGLGAPEKPVPLGAPPGEPVEVPKHLVANFHFGIGFPVLRLNPTYRNLYWNLPNQVEVEPDYIRLMPERVGVYQIRLTVPFPPPGVEVEQCSIPNVTVSLASAVKSLGRYQRYDAGLTDGIQLCVKVPTEEK